MQTSELTGVAPASSIARKQLIQMERSSSFYITTIPLIASLALQGDSQAGDQGVCGGDGGHKLGDINQFSTFLPDLRFKTSLGVRYKRHRLQWS